MKFFVAQFILIEEILDGVGPSIKSIEHFLDSSLFMAPDAERLYFVSNGTGFPSIYVMLMSLAILTDLFLLWKRR
jgi:hypothetical protein